MRVAADGGSLCGMSRRLIPAVALLLAACSANPTPTVQVTPPLPSVSQPPKCTDVFTPGKVVELRQPSFTCLNPDGGWEHLTGMRCADGGYLWQVSPQSGPPLGWVLAGQPYQTSKTADIADDPGYGKAFTDCNR